MLNDPYYIVIHHSATSDRVTLNDFDSIRRYHMSYAIDGYIVNERDFRKRKAIEDGKYFKFPWVDIGYHYVIEYDNQELRVRAGRDVYSTGAHAYQRMPDKNGGMTGMNKQSIGICVVGNYDVSTLDTEVREELIKLSGAVSMYFGIEIENIIGHREVTGVTKSCPGIYIDMNEIRSEVGDRFCSFIN